MTEAKAIGDLVPALAEQPKQQQQPSETRPDGALTVISRLEQQLQPAKERQGNGELAACLTLVAPSGMSAEDRKEWLRVARLTLSGIPADLLAIGCKKARETCRFASEIVPTILAEAKPLWEGRRRRLHEERQLEAMRNAPRLPEPERVTPEQIKEIKAELRAEREAREATTE